MNVPRLVVLAWGLLVGVLVSAESVRLPRESGEVKLADKLIAEALRRGGQYTAEYPYGDIESIPLSTVIRAVDNHELDVFWTLASPEYEAQFQAVYIPLYRGMLGMRLAIVKAENRHQFAEVDNVDDLRRFSAGQGRFWADSDILEKNFLPVVRELKYANLFRMLEADRFDYFPRGIQEPWLEIKREAHLNLVVEPSIMLWYKAPFYFFVRKDNPELAAHLTEQLEAMIADGTFNKMFMQDPETQMALKNANISDRKIIPLDNPLLSDKTPLERSELWLDPKQFSQTLYLSRGDK